MIENIANPSLLCGDRTRVDASPEFVGCYARDDDAPLPAAVVDHILSSSHARRRAGSRVAIEVN
jgi:hypothetical protein